MPPSCFVCLSKCSNQVMPSAASELAPVVQQHVFTIDIAALSCTMHSTPSETVSLVKGPDGLAIAKFSNTVHVTELANILLSPVAELVKARADRLKAAKVKARPAAAAAVAAPAAAAIAPAAAAAAPAAAPVRFCKETVTVERSRSRVLARTGLRGPGQNKQFPYGRGKPYGNIPAAKRAGQAWLDA